MHITKVNNTKVKVVSFQPREVVEELLSTGRYISHNRPKRTNPYHGSAKDGLYPLYSFYRVTDDSFGSSCSPLALYKRWGDLMGYWKLDGRDVIEFDIPISECDLYTEFGADPLYFGSLPSDCAIECITYEFKKEWVVQVYEKDVLWSGYEAVKLTPTLECKDSLFDVEVTMSGDGYSEKDIFTKFPSKAFLGRTFKDNRCMINKTLSDRLFEILLKEIYTEYMNWYASLAYKERLEVDIELDVQMISTDHINILKRPQYGLERVKSAAFIGYQTTPEQ